MSLRAFHIIFISISILLCVGVALWAFFFTREEGMEITVIGFGCSAAAVALFIYGINFIRKTRDLIV